MFQSIQSVSHGGRARRTASSSPSFFHSVDCLQHPQVGHDADRAPGYVSSLIFSARILRHFKFQISCPSLFVILHIICHVGKLISEQAYIKYQQETHQEESWWHPRWETRQEMIPLLYFSAPTPPLPLSYYYYYFSFFFPLSYASSLTTRFVS